ADAMVADDEYRRTLAAGLLTRYLGLSFATPAPTDDPRINGIVTQLAAGTQVQNVIASLLASEEGYRKTGSTLALPVGSHAEALASGNFPGPKDGVGNFIPDLAVALPGATAGSHVVQIYRGRVGGGFDLTPSLTLSLPAGATPADLLVADFDGKNGDDLAVANGGLDSSTGNSVSVFLNNHSAVGQVSFGAR